MGLRVCWIPARQPSEEGDCAAVVGEGGNHATVEVKWGASHAQAYFQSYSIMNNWGFDWLAFCLFVFLMSYQMIGDVPECHPYCQENLNGKATA